MESTVVEVIPNRLFFMISSKPPKDIPKAFYFNIDKDLEYQPFYQDFGPLSLAKIWKFTNEMQKILNLQKFKDCILYHLTSTDFKKNANAALLICCSQMILHKKSADEIWKLFSHINFVPFRDASYGQCTYQCTILDCLRGVEYAMKLNWFNYKTFNLAEYEHYERIQNGDLNWIIPNKFIAFSSPSGRKTDEFGNQLYTPKDYIGIFKKLGVDTVIRLNTVTYNKEQFIENGIRHHDLYFQDGTSPPREIVNRFFQIVENQHVFAVHCKAGLGRTGSLIGCYALKHYCFNAADFIGWIRMCRPGSILGSQQYFILNMQKQMKESGQNSPIWKEISMRFEEKEIEEQMKRISLKDKQISHKNIEEIGDNQQGQWLINRKKQSIKG